MGKKKGKVSGAAAKNKGKKNVTINKEEKSENWCFVCKDGGDLRICDYKDCVKSYHPECVNKDDSFLENEEHWACDWHTCSKCSRAAAFHCYTCPNAVCRRCHLDSNFSKIKGKYGFCTLCLRLALLIEDNHDVDSDGESVNFNDRETYEGLYKEYYDIVKGDEGFDADDVFSTLNEVKVRKNRRSENISDDSVEVEDVATDDDEYDDDDDDDSEPEPEKKHRRMENKFENRIAAMKAAAKSGKTEFVGWASKRLLEFLTAIGKSTDEKMSQHDVATIVNDYIKENKLINPEKKRNINCDGPLQALFKRRTVSRYRINDLLEEHFAENQEDSEDDDKEDYISENNDSDVSVPSKKQKKRKRHDEIKIQKEEIKSYRSPYAAILPENIKLVYLKKGLVHELLKQPESFEEKAVGCFVRVISNPQERRSKHIFHLMQITGVKNLPNGENSSETFLKFSDIPEETSVNFLSEEDFTKEECESFREKVTSGQIEKPTVAYLDKKAKMIHKDRMNHWIRKELVLLQNLIDRANEKGWRQERFEYMEKKRRLQNPAEVQMMLENVPFITPDAFEFPEPTTDFMLKD
ncbi:uncharacterized protein At5g08430 [Andrographis paniculata]|uniref:uncharacterized protein At5g08430 n=1 Tax=Andrographis paniculata TaxID=175694 RepID=UPI0021E76E83|nr:uncharacterized protein At5g08430 [Andrographis paniculata]